VFLVVLLRRKEADGGDGGQHRLRLDGKRIALDTMLERTIVLENDAYPSWASVLCYISGKKPLRVRYKDVWNTGGVLLHTVCIQENKL
jgi:hypothetical protein